MSARLPLLTLLLLCAQQAVADDRRFLYLLPEGFSGWVCVDFGVAGAPALLREGMTRIIRPQVGETLKTSDTTGPSPIEEARIEVGGLRRPLPEDVYERRQSSRTDTKSPVKRQCRFFGTEDAADAAGEAPGFESSPEEARGISAEERQALIALYEATDGAHWKHRVGWLGPPGTECSWHGVQCGWRDPARTVVRGLDLGNDNLAGAIPKAVEYLADLESLYVFDNHLSGKLPEAMLNRWLAGSLEVSCDASLITDVSRIDYESAATSLLCASHRIVLRADGTANAYAERCRLATPGDRTTFCEVKNGRIPPREFGRLGLLLEKGGFFRLQSDYSRNVTDSGQETTRVVRAGVPYQVSNYATAGPMELWSAQRTIEGVAATVEWEHAKREPKCPGEKDIP